MASLPENIDQIIQIAVSVDAIHLFVAVAVHLLIAPAESISEVTHGRVPQMLELMACHI